MGFYILEPVKTSGEDDNGKGKTLGPEYSMHTYKVNKVEEDEEMALHLSQSHPWAEEKQECRANMINNSTKDREDGVTLPSSASTDPPPLKRLASLDVFRGLAVALMILVDDAGGLLPAINHSPWNGLTLADFVMPFFLFIVGASVALTYKKLSCRLVATKKAILRTAKLLVLGIFLQGGFLHGLNDLSYGVDVKQIRWTGILQRIAVGYLLVALCEIWLKADHVVISGLSLLKKYQYQWAVAFVLTSLYLCLLYGLYVPNWEYQISVGTASVPKIFSVKCGVRGDTGPACNAAGMIDRKILGIQHLHKRPVYARTKQCSIYSPDYGPLPPYAPSWCQAPFDPEGLLSSIMAMVTCLVGLHYGHIIVHLEDHRVRVLNWMVPTFCFFVLGLALNLLGLHINKALYSFSYMCVTAGAAGILFVGIYLMVDVCGCHRMTIVMEWMGKHAMTIYILAASNILPVVVQGFYWGHPQNDLLKLIGISSSKMVGNF